MGWEVLPEDGGPFKEHVADVERVQSPGPLRVADSKVFVEACCFGIANVSCL